MNLTAYLSGETHTDWRRAIEEGIAKSNLKIGTTSAVTDHHASDHCGVEILGEEESSFWKDNKGARINRIRNQTLIKKADVVIVRFGPKYRQWNAAFDAGYAIAHSKPLITIHDEERDHALKEIDSAANATARNPEQVVEILRYITQDASAGKK